ncbi:MAG: hypothetical protein QM831_38225 [Kofleriaceae bacterium]
MTVVGAPAGRGRLPFTFHAHGGVGRLALVDLHAGPLHVERLELDVTDLGTNPGTAPAEKYQRRRTRLRNLSVRAPASALEAGVEAARRHLAGLGITHVAARLCDGFVSVRARAADGLAAADVTFRIQLANTGTHLRALASHVRVHGHLPTPGPTIADRIITALLGATDAVGVVERPHVRGLCDVEIDLVGALLWHLMPPAGWRLPAVSDIELLSVRIGRAAIEIAFGPPGARNGEPFVRQQPLQLAAAHDLMHSADSQLRDGHIEDAMRGYRALLAAGGPDQPHLLERILALAAARPAWFFDGLELARQALGRWPHFPAAHAALASITLAQGDAREAASHLTHVAQLASAEGDDDQASLAALAGARLLRVLEPRAATQLYELALEHDPSSLEAADALADRLVDESRWAELVRLLRSRAQQAQHTDHLRAVQLHLRLADVFAHQMKDPGNAHLELSAARALSPDDPAVHEMSATILSTTDPRAAVNAWREVARLAEGRGDARTAARAYATLGDSLDRARAVPQERITPPAGNVVDDRLISRRSGLMLVAQAEEPEIDSGAEVAWRRALDHDPLQADAIAGLAAAAQRRGDHVVAAEYFERLRGLGLPQTSVTRHELALARSLVALDRLDDARGSLRRATLAGGETAAEAHAILADIAQASSDSEHAAAELDTAISSYVGLAIEPADHSEEDRMYARAAELAAARAALFDRTGDAAGAAVDWERAHGLAVEHAPEIARDAARTMLDRAVDPLSERRWIDAVLATRPPQAERADLLVRRADVRRKEATPDLAAALADLHEALSLTEEQDADPALRRRAYALEAELLSKSGDAKARAQALAAIAKMAERGPTRERMETEAAAAAAWLAADEPAAALPHGARAHAELDANVPSHLRREVLRTLGEAAWRQRAWPDVIRAYRGLIEDAQTDVSMIGTARYRLAVAADRTGDANMAVQTLRPLAEDVYNAASPSEDVARATTPELRGQALRLFADLAERSGDLPGAASALEGFAQLAADTTPSARADAMYRAGELFRRADRGDDAVRCLEAALRISDTHLPALDALEAQWRERGDLERVAVILGRKVAATARHPARQKPLLSRLGDLQDQLGRPDVALATHQRALEIDPSWRLSLRYVTQRLAHDHAVVAAAGGFAQLAGDLSGDNALDLPIVLKDRQAAVKALAQLIVGLGESQVEAVASVAQPVMARAAIDPGLRGETSLDVITAALQRLRGEGRASSATSSEEDTMSGRMKEARQGALSLRDGARRARAAGRIGDAFAALEAANHVAPGDVELLHELGELAIELGDYPAAARHLGTRAELVTGTKQGEALQELADLYYDRIDDAPKAREAMRRAADAFTGMRRDTTLRLLATEASAHLAWDVASEALAAIPADRRTSTDLVALASAFVRSGKNVDAIAMIDAAQTAGQFDDGGKLLAELHAEVARKAQLARTYEWRAQGAKTEEAAALRADAAALLRAIGGGDDADTDQDLLKTMQRQQEAQQQMMTDPEIEVPGEFEAAPGVIEIEESMPEDDDDDEPAVTITSSRPEVDESDDYRARPRRDSQRAISSGAIDAALAESKLRRASTLDDDGEPEPAAPEVPIARTASGRLPAMIVEDFETDDRYDRHKRITAVGEVDDEPVAPRAISNSESSGRIRMEADVSASGKVRSKSGKIITQPDPDDEFAEPSVSVSGTRQENSDAVKFAAAFADRDRLLEAHRASPDDPAILAALLSHLANSEDGGDLRRGVLDRAALESHGRAQAIALHELALIARGEAHDPIRATALWNKAYRVDPSYAPVWMPYADALAGADEIELAIELYEQIAKSTEYDGVRRKFAGERADILGRDDSVVSGEIGGPKPVPVAPGVELSEARQLADAENTPAAIAAAERAAAAHPEDREPLELLERLYAETGDVTAASEAIGRQLVLTEDPLVRSSLWRRRARLYRGVQGREAEAYRCLKEAHACAPADPEVAYQLRTAAMVRGEWALVASLLYREIAASQNPRDRGALHLELALIFQERLSDPDQAQVNFEQAIAFDPTIPAVRAPLAKRYEAIGRRAEAARLYEEAATTARASDRADLLAAAARCRANIEAPIDERAGLAARLEQAAVEGNTEGALELAHQLWRLDPGHAEAFRVLASSHRLSGDLPALTELTTLRAAKATAGEEKAAAWLEVAHLAEELGRYGESARAYDLALIEDPGHTDALDARGALAFKLGDWPTADSIYRDLGPGESVLGEEELMVRRSIISEHLGRDSEALELARMAAAAAPGRRDILMRIQELANRLGETALALVAARAVLDLIPLDDDEALLATHFALVDLYRQLGDLDSAVGQLDRIIRDHPHHAFAIEQLAEVHIARGDWHTATRYLYQLVPLAPSPGERAERLYRLGEAVLSHLGDVDRADDVFLRASDLDPSHVPTLRRLLDVYWRADDPAALVDVSAQLAASGSLSPGPIARTSLAQALVAAALLGDTNLAAKLVYTLGEDGPTLVADALIELTHRPRSNGAGRRFEVKSASTAVAELGRRGVIDLAKLRVAVAGTPIEPELA